MQLRMRALTSAVLLACSAGALADDDKTLAEVWVKGTNYGSYNAGAVQVGTFRDMTPLEVPATSNVMTRELLDAQAANTLFGALKNAAGVTRAQLSGSTYDNLSLRGILVNNRSNYRLNGSLPVINLVDTPLENKERVEVLKGVSSLYYGFVPPSGIVNLVTKRAGKQPVQSVTLNANQHGGHNVHLDVGSRFGERQQFGARVNLLAGREEVGIDNYEGKRELASAALDWRVNNKLSFKLDLEHYRKQASEQALIRQPAAVNGRITLPAPLPNSRNLAGEWQQYDAKANNALLRADYQLSDNWGLLAEAGYARTERDRNAGTFQNYNLATGEGTLNIGFNRDQWWKNANYRTELFGSVGTGPLTHELTFGYTANIYEQSYLTFNSVNVAQNLYHPRSIAERSPGAATGAQDNQIDERAFYVFDRIKLGQRWQAMLGARRSQFEQDTVNRNASGTATSVQRYAVEETSPALSLMFQPTPKVAVYGSYLEGLSVPNVTGVVPQSKGSTPYANFGEQLAPARASQRELGVKAELAQGVLLQAAYFDIRQPTLVDETVNGSLFMRVNGLSRYRGVELAANGELSKHWSLAASAVLMNAQQLNTNNANTFGKAPEDTPERAGSLFAEYRLPQVAGLALSGGAYYVGKRAVNAQNQAFIPSYTTWSLGARYATRIAGQRTTFQAVLDNAANKDYWASAGNGLLGQGAPRTLKLSAKIDL
jgi:iron complex outermembrane receptor protein